MRSKAKTMVAAVWLAGLAAGCARHAGSQAAAGAMETLKQQAAQPTPSGERPIEVIAGRAVDSAIRRLQDPEQVAALRALIGTLAAHAAAEARRSLMAGIKDDLGSEGGGPLASRMAATARQTAVSATDGALLRLFPQCSDSDVHCLDRRLADLSREAAGGFVQGARESLRLTAVLVAFAAGAIATLLVVLAVVLIRTRRQLRGALVLTPARQH